ncbi:(Fe-S)-binding protein [Helicobacter cetorum]|uniref:Glycolate oxidase iron-sulfur subunit n=1 Tax=Helicobacter cetorum (strain ATCC BAA-540 / CCUG 52418 / MIT 99-5656) TaxID=1163745 RepID=I0ESY4_HELCM|nr:(Fe-S)-binding protein [Helicobacter cetorum]AFI06053.1 glycerol-3-phosphatedehydrogenase [Helicobacter cetorum MIT 99-5656]
MSENIFEKVGETCVKCAKCVPTCTIYRIHKDESTSPRGFLDLMRLNAQNKLKLDTNLKTILETCFLCTACVETCPFHLPIDTLIEKAREKIAQKYGIAWYKKSYFSLLKNRQRMDRVFSIAHFLAPCAFKQSGDSLEPRMAFKSLFKRFNKSTLPPLNKKSFLQTHSKPKPLENPIQKVAIFIGCLSNYHYQQVGESLLYILERLNIQAIIPKQECCGVPAFFTGDKDTTLFLAKKNIELFESYLEEVNAIIVPEATCASMLIRDYPKLFLEQKDEKEYLKRLEKITPKIYLSSVFLDKFTPLKSLLEKTPKRKQESITYHDPCHARKTLKAYQEVRNLLSTHYEIKEMQDNEKCCGFGGISLQTNHSKLSSKAGLLRAKDINSTQAKIVSAECGACHMQLNNALKTLDKNKSPQFLHPLELIAKALKETSNP